MIHFWLQIKPGGPIKSLNFKNLLEISLKPMVLTTEKSFTVALSDCKG